MQPFTVTAVRQLDAGDLAALVALQHECEQFDGADLKVSPERAARGPQHLLLRRAMAIDGYAGLDDGHELEICGMVRPSARRLGGGRALLEAALAGARSLGRENALVICEDVFPAAHDWIERLGGTLHSSEARMVLPGLEAVPRLPSGLPRITLAPARPNDRDVLISLLAEGFHGVMERDVLERVIEVREDEGDQAYIAWHDGEAVATLRLVAAPGRWMIYGLVVRSALQGRRIGTATMHAALDLLRGRHAAEVSLEVNLENTPALRLYEGLGFRTVTTYRYLRLPTAALDRAVRPG